MTKYKNICIPQDHPFPLKNQDNQHTKTAEQMTDLSKARNQQKQPSSRQASTINQQDQLHFRYVYLVFSRIHNQFKLRFQTVCLATQLYFKFKELVFQPEKQIPENYIVLCSIYIAMKIEQIYPPLIKHLSPFVKIGDIDLKTYIQYQSTLLQKIKLNLNVKTAKTIIDQMMPNQNKQTYFYVYYLLEICYYDYGIFCRYPIEIICKSILFLMSPISDSLRKIKQFNGSPFEDINMCSKLLLQRKCHHFNKNSNIYAKYSSDRYMKVADKSIVLSP